MKESSLPVRNGQFNVDILQSGDGLPLLFLHGIGGLQWDPFLERLASSHRVIAPRMPGFGGSTGSETLSDIHDLVYFYLDLLDALDLRDFAIVGHSLGGMIAAELAAVQPERFTKVVLIAPLGLWDPEHPVLDFFSVAPAELSQAMYFDQKSEAAKALASTPQAKLPEVDPDTEEGKAVIDFYVERAKSMSTAAKYLWPIPNKGLSKRLHRLTQQTLLIWGADDGICPPAYGIDFMDTLPNATLHLVPEAAHMVCVEQPDAVAELVAGFVGEA
ncbi:MAG: alpha/beta hydrolase [Chloroflexi bacterium]|nr:alpha/beta hydrolase [Chloroflexota bacterium]